MKRSQKCQSKFNLGTSNVHVDGMWYNSKKPLQQGFSNPESLGGDKTLAAYINVEGIMEQRRVQ